jgi:hypothetical protein
MRARLMSLGYRQIKTAGMGGPNNKGVFRKGKFGKPGQVDVALMENFERKRWENNLLSTTPLKLLMRFAPKKVRTHVWWRAQQL